MSQCNTVTERNKIKNKKTAKERKKKMMKFINRLTLIEKKKLIITTIKFVSFYKIDKALEESLITK